MSPRTHPPELLQLQYCKSVFFVGLFIALLFQLRNKYIEYFLENQIFIVNNLNFNILIIDRILQIIDFKGINKNKFYKEAGLSNGFLDKVRKDIGSSKIEQILNAYPEINPDWFLTGEGKC